MQFKGTAHRYGRDIDTDVIIPARYLNTSDPAELAKHCLEDLDTDVHRKRAAGRHHRGRRELRLRLARASTRPSPSRRPASTWSSPRASRASSTATPSTPASPSWNAPRRWTPSASGDVVSVDADAGVIARRDDGPDLPGAALPAVHQGDHRSRRPRSTAGASEAGRRSRTMAKTYNICLLPGDGIGPEIIAEGVQGAGRRGREVRHGVLLHRGAAGRVRHRRDGHPRCRTRRCVRPSRPTPCCWRPSAARSGTPPTLRSRAPNRACSASARRSACTRTCVPCRSSPRWPTASTLQARDRGRRGPDDRARADRRFVLRPPRALLRRGGLRHGRRRGPARLRHARVPRVRGRAHRPSSVRSRAQAPQQGDERRQGERAGDQPHVARDRAPRPRRGVRRTWSSRTCSWTTRPCSSSTARPTSTSW